MCRAHSRDIAMVITTDPAAVCRGLTSELKQGPLILREKFSLTFDLIITFTKWVYVHTPITPSQILCLSDRVHNLYFPQK